MRRLGVCPGRPADAPISPTARVSGTEPARAGEMIYAESRRMGESPSSGETPPAKRGAAGKSRRTPGRKPLRRRRDAACLEAEHGPRTCAAERRAQDTRETPKEAETLRKPRRALRQPVGRRSRRRSRSPQHRGIGWPGWGHRAPPSGPRRAGAQTRFDRRRRRRGSTHDARHAQRRGGHRGGGHVWDARRQGARSRGRRSRRQAGEGPGHLRPATLGQAGSGRPVDRASPPGSPKQAKITSERPRRLVVASRRRRSPPTLVPASPARQGAGAGRVEEAEEVRA